LKPYLEAHDAFVAWLDGDAHCDPSAADVARELRLLALCAADRGMSEVHWSFGVDGLIAHAKIRCPSNAILPDYISRGFDLSNQWAALRAPSAHPHATIRGTN
jgi:hypothetical protein